jgi:hypothetical protein
MNPWHTFTDSDAFRWFAKRGPGRPIFRSRAFRNANVARNFIRTSYACRRNPELFRDVRTFCFFVGHNKSGTSLVGGLLDAHPNVILSDEVDVLQYVEAGFSRDQIFHLLLKGSRAEARKGRVTARRLQPYSYWVQGGWQGRIANKPLAVGDSTSGSSTRRLGESPDLLDRLPRRMDGVDVRLIQVIRNPFDPISVSIVRGRRTFQDAIDRYFSACETLVEIRNRVGTSSLLAVRYETFVADPERGLEKVCRFVGVDADPEYLSACARIIRRRPDRSREMVEWTRSRIAQVERQIATFDFLDGYSYGS